MYVMHCLSFFVFLCCIITTVTRNIGLFSHLPRPTKDAVDAAKMKKILVADTIEHTIDLDDTRVRTNVNEIAM